MGTARRFLLPAVVALALLWAPTASFAAITGRIVENVGIKTAKLGLLDSTDAHRIGGSYKRVKNTDYQGVGLTVYEFYFGSRLANKKYPVEMYSKSNHRVYAFIIYTTKLVTKNGTHVGTAESTLKSRYGPKLKSLPTSVYTDYYMTSSTGRTDFWVKAGKVHHIVIARL
jgi:hypothetical protein